MDDHLIGIGDRRPCRAGGEITHVNRIADAEIGDVDDDAVGNVRGQHFHFDFAMHEVEHAAVHLDAARFALERDRHGDLDLAIHVDAIEIRVQRMMRDRIELHVLREDARLGAAVDLEGDQRVEAGRRVEDAEERLRIDRHGLGSRHIADLLRAVDDRRKASGRAKAARFVLTLGVALGGVENCFHDVTDLSRASEVPTPFAD